MINCGRAKGFYQSEADSDGLNFPFKLCVILEVEKGKFT